MAVIKKTFYSVSEMRAAVSVDPSTLHRSVNRAGLAEWHKRNDHKWHGLDRDKQGNEPALATLNHIMASGWQRGVDLMASVKPLDVASPVSIRRRSRWTDQGDELDMQRVYNGQLDTAWRRCQRVSMSAPRRVRLVVDSIASAGEDSASMRWRGVAAMRAADTLQAAGYQVEVESAFTGKCNMGRVVARCVVKSFDQPVNLSALASTTALPAFFRVYGHMLQPVLADALGKDMSYGGYMVEKLVEADLDPQPGERLLIVPQRVSNADRASDWLASAIASIDEPEQLAA